jgi:hypothetical protein
MSRMADFESFLSTPEPAQLGPGARSGAKPQAVLRAHLQPLLEASGLPSPNRQLIEALILLWHDHLDGAHAIAQEVDGADGALVHGMMHRREPDFSNAAYWFRRAGRHPSFEKIATEVAPLLETKSPHDLAAKLIRNRQWEPFAFIDACEAASRGSGEDQDVLREIQRIEFNASLDYFCR